MYGLNIPLMAQSCRRRVTIRGLTKRYKACAKLGQVSEVRMNGFEIKHTIIQLATVSHSIAERTQIYYSKYTRCSTCASRNTRKGLLYTRRRPPSGSMVHSKSRCVWPGARRPQVAYRRTFKHVAWARSGDGASALTENTPLKRDSVKLRSNRLRRRWWLG